MKHSYPFDTFSAADLTPPALPRDRVRGALKTAGALAALTATLPLTAAGALARRARVEAPASPRPTARRTVLINTARMTKGLTLIRAFHAAGHRVIVVDVARYRLAAHRFSRAVGAFYVVPDPLDDLDAYRGALVDIITREGVDLFVPVTSPVGASLDAQVGAGLPCRVLHFDAATCDTLDDKGRFAEAAAAAGLTVPETARVTDPAQIADYPYAPGARYLAKPALYDPIGRQAKRALPFDDRAEMLAWARDLGVAPERPWVIQRFVEGDEYCAHATVVGGRVVVYVCTESSPYQLNYAPVEQPAIRAWVMRFVDAAQISDGQLCFDFLVDAEGTPYAIECNPRLHSAITAFHDQPAALADAYLGRRAADRGPLEPTPGVAPTYWLACEIERLTQVRRPAQLRRWAEHVRAGRDAVFDPTDPLPFVALHHLQIPSLLLRNLTRSGRWTHVDWCIGKVVEPGGD